MRSVFFSFRYDFDKSTFKRASLVFACGWKRRCGLLVLYGCCGGGCSVVRYETYDLETVGRRSEFDDVWRCVFYGGEDDMKFSNKSHLDDIRWCRGVVAVFAGSLSAARKGTYFAVFVWWLLFKSGLWYKNYYTFTISYGKSRY